jgi:hypothetical protein
MEYVSRREAAAEFVGRPIARQPPRFDEAPVPQLGDQISLLGLKTRRERFPAFAQGVLRVMRIDLRALVYSVPAVTYSATRLGLPDGPS